MNNFSIVHHAGQVRRAVTPQGVTVERQESIFVPEWGALVTCAPYDEHFIFENPDVAEGTPAHVCTCGSVAVVVPPGPAGMFVCLFHATYGAHSTSFVNVDEFNKSAGQTLDIKPERAKWL